MKKEEEQYVKRTQRDYSYGFKIQVVQENERGEASTVSAQRKYGIQSRSTVMNWLRKHGTFDWYNQTPSNLAKTPEQKFMELKQKVRHLEKQKNHLEQSDKNSILFDIMIELAEKK